MNIDNLNSLELGNIEILDASELLMDIDSLCNLGKDTDAEFPDEVSGSIYNSEQWLDNNGFWDEQIKEIRKGMDKQLPVEHYAKDCYNWMQMREIRKGMLDGVNTEIYENPLYSAEQMYEIRMGLAEGLDVSRYARLSYTAKDMARYRKKLLQAEYSINPKGFAKIFEDEESGIRIRISDDCMEAFITFTRGTDYSLGEVRKLLARNEIVYGILSGELEKAWSEHEEGKEVKIAQGDKDKPGEDGRYKFCFNPLLPGKPREMEDGTVDYTEIVEVDKISAGDVLAQYYPAIPGQDGMTVTGIPIKGKIGREYHPLTGRGFEYNKENNTYTATMDGYAFADEEKGTMDVWNIYVVDGDVNRYTNGHIIYDGIVHIRGNVGDMAMIEASGNIVVEGIMESAYLVAGKNVILKGGVHGGEKGIIRAGRKVMGKFFESVEIYAGGDVEGNFFMNCLVQTDGRLIARGKKGRIIGGNMQVLGGVAAVSIGNYNAGTKTILDVGNVMQTEDRRKVILTKLYKGREEIKQLENGKNKLAQMLGEELAENNELFKKSCQAIKVIEEQRLELENDLHYLDILVKRASKAQVIVYGSLQDGVRIIMNGKRREIQSPPSGKIIIDNDLKGE